MISLKSSVFFSRFEGGVVFRGGARPLIFKGERTYELVEALVRRIDRGGSQESVLASLPEKARPAAARMMSELAGCDLLRERAVDDPQPDPEVLERFGGIWNYLSDNHARPGEAMARWAATPFQIHGDPQTQLYVARALLECGARRISLSDAGGRSDAGTEGAVRTLADLARAFPQSDLAIGTSSGADAVQILASCSDRPAASIHDAWCLAVVCDHLLIARIAGNAAVTLEGWRKRLRPALPDRSGARIAPLRLALAANALAFGLFRSLAGLAGEPDLSSPHVLLPSGGLRRISPPAAVRAGDPVTDEQGAAPRAEPAATESPEERERLSVLLDPISGALQELHSDLAQVPLFLVQAAVRPREPEGPESVVLGWGLTHEEAWRRAVQRGVAAMIGSAPELEARALAVIVEFSDQACAEASRAAARALSDASTPWRPVGPDEFTDPAVFKLLKLLRLLTGEAAEVSARIWDDGPATVSIKIGSSRLASATAGGLDAAAYLAAGDACAALQTGSGPSLCRARPAGGPVLMRPVDPGYPDLEGVVFCRMVERGEG